jgi:hypothetical protein
VGCGKDVPGCDQCASTEQITVIIQARYVGKSAFIDGSTLDNLRFERIRARSTVDKKRKENRS